MAPTAATDEAALVAEEARLARAAAGGDGVAFATLYERYEPRAYNLAYRIAGSEADAADAVQEAFLSVMRRLPQLGDRELAFGSYLFTATRNACYDLLAARRRSRPSEAIPESATPLGSGAGGLGLDPGDPEEDPDRRQLLAAQQEEIREANARLPERQREALALRELEELSYDEIAEIMEMNRNSVAQLISRARINLHDELRSTALAAIAAASPECERALPLIAMRDDGQLELGDDEAWLDSHLAGCERCRLGVEAMQEAGVSYRAWAPIAAAPWLLEETMAKAAEQAGADWSEEIAAHAARRPAPGSLPGMPSTYLIGAAGGGSRRRRRGPLAAILAVLILVALLATISGGDDDTPAEPQRPAAVPAAEPVPAVEPVPSGDAGRKGDPAGRQSQPGPDPEPAPEAPPAPTEPITSGPEPSAGGGDRNPSPLEPDKPPADPGVDSVKPKPRPQPQATPAPPEAVPPPPVEEPAEVEEPAPEEPPRDPNRPTPGSPPSSGVPLP